MPDRAAWCSTNLSMRSLKRVVNTYLIIWERACTRPGTYIRVNEGWGSCRELFRVNMIAGSIVGCIEQEVVSATAELSWRELASMCGLKACDAERCNAVFIIKLGFFSGLPDITNLCFCHECCLWLCFSFRPFYLGYDSFSFLNEPVKAKSIALRLALSIAFFLAIILNRSIAQSILPSIFPL